VCLTNSFTLYVSVSFHQRSTLIFILLLLLFEGQVGPARKLSYKATRPDIAEH